MPGRLHLSALRRLFLGALLVLARRLADLRAIALHQRLRAHRQRRHRPRAAGLPCRGPPGWQRRS